MTNAAHESLKRYQRRQAKARYYGRRCTTRAKKTNVRQQMQEEPGWLCDCGAWIDGLFHCSNCRNEPPCGCPCSFCQDPEPDEYDETGDEFYDPEEPFPGEFEDVPGFNNL